MKNAIVKLMIATMIVDGDLYIHEFKVIQGAIKILGLDDKEYNELINEAKEIRGYDEVLKWVKPALDTLRAMNDPAVSSLAIAYMVLVANADGEIQDAEVDLIQHSASFLDVSAPTLR
jgi:uncharacterized tellurite resistance protein B-like protein|tara:strand:- start:836 stop:1189 length:354 start_codon:yes stop_codon:yes gene_type:complete